MIIILVSLISSWIFVFIVLALNKAFNSECFKYTLEKSKNRPRYTYKTEHYPGGYAEWNHQTNQWEYKTVQ